MTGSVTVLDSVTFANNLSVARFSRCGADLSVLDESMTGSAISVRAFAHQVFRSLKWNSMLVAE